MSAFNAISSDQSMYKAQLHMGYRVRKKLFHKTRDGNIVELTFSLQINKNITDMNPSSYIKLYRPKALRISSTIMALRTL